MFFLKNLPTRQILEAYAKRFPNMNVEWVETALSTLRSASLLLRRLEAYFAEHGLSQTRFLILILIDRESEKTGLTATEIVEQLDISKPVVSTTLKSLVREGLIESFPNEKDARSRLFGLSQQGKNKIDALMPGYYELLHEYARSQPS